MAVISDLGGTSQNSFSINGKITLFQGEGIPSDLMGNNGDVYFKHEGLIYIKRNGTWLTNDPEDIKWIPDPRNHQNRLLYSSGENYEMTEITYNDNSEEPHQLELFNTPNTDYSLNSKIVPNIGWINDPEKNNVLHKSGNESKTDTLSLKNKFGSIGNNNISNNQMNFTDINDNILGVLKNILNTSNETNIENNSVITQLSAKSGNNESKINIIAKSDGTKYATAPTPSSNASNNEIVTVEWLKNLVRDTLYPIDSIYITVSNDNPSNILGVGTWQKIDSGRVLQSSGNGHNAGTTVEAGLPNITGKIKPGKDHGGLNAEGCFYQTNEIATTSHKGTTDVKIVAFDASRSSSIYGKSNTVQPPAYIVNIWRRIA